MNLTLWVAFGALLPALGAQARQPSPAPDPTDPSVTVPATVHQSALSAYVPLAKDMPPPDKSWRAANEAVAALPGHGGHAAPATAPKTGPTSAPTSAPKNAATPASGGEKARTAVPPAAPERHDKHHTMHH